MPVAAKRAGVLPGRATVVWLGWRADATAAAAILIALSFGLLAFSSMPALSGFGLTLLLGICVSVLLAPMVLSFTHEGAA